MNDDDLPQATEEEIEAQRQWLETGTVPIEYVIERCSRSMTNKDDLILPRAGPFGCHHCMEDQAMRCVACGSPMITQRENHHYTGCGLSNVWLVDMDVSRCTSCDAVEVAIPAVEKLHAKLATMVAESRGRLVPEQIRFLRKYLGCSTVRFARKMGCDRSTVHRWETGDVQMQLPEERLLRLLVLHDSPVTNYNHPIDLESLGVQDPITESFKACLKDGSWAAGAGAGADSQPC